MQPKCILECYYFRRRENTSAGLKQKKCPNPNSTLLIRMILLNKYGADTFRMYEMFLGPVEQQTLGYKRH